MLHTLRIGAVVVAGALLLGGRPATTMAQPTPAAATCAQSKEKAIGKHLLKTLKCYSKAAKDGLSRDPAVNADPLGTCLADVSADTTDAFDTADAVGGCATDANIFNLNPPEATGDGMISSILSQDDKGYAVNAMTIGYRGINGPREPEFNPDATGQEPDNAGVVQLVAPGTAASKCAKKQLLALAVLGKKLHLCEKSLVGYVKKFDKGALEGDCINTAARDTLAGYMIQVSNVVIPNIPRWNGCGNGLVTNGSGGTLAETCDDGNLVNLDSCPSDCVIDACSPDPMTPVAATLHIAGTNALNVAGLTIELDYPEGKLDLPGTGFGVASVQDLTFADSFDTLDVDHALRVVASSASAFGTTDIANMDYVDCTGAIAAVPGDFTCVVKQAVGAGGAPDYTASTTCSVTIP
jgi:hypothetical protein